MKKKRLIKRGMLLTVTIACLNMMGCSSQISLSDTAVELSGEQEQESEGITEKGIVKNMTSSAGKDEAINVIKAKYQAGEADYSGNIIEVKNDENIEMKLGFNPWDLESEVDIHEDIVIYKDAEMTQPLDLYGYDYDVETGMLTIEPLLYGIAEMDEGEGMDLSDLSGDYLYDSDGGKSTWGNVSQYYMVTKIDLETGKRLEKPEITVVKIKHEISQAPQMKFTQTENGEARFYWQPVEGADEYLIFSVDDFGDELGLDERAVVVGRTTGNEWVCESTIFDDVTGEGDVSGIMNQMFEHYYFSEDSYGESDFDSYDEYSQEYFGVIAINHDGSSSAISSLLSKKDLSHMLPNTIAYRVNDENDSYVVESTLALPATMGVTMCDGSTVQKLLTYDFENIVKSEYGTSYIVVAKIDGTIFEQSISVYLENWDTLEKDMATIQKRQEELKNKGGNVEPTIEFKDEKEDDGTSKTDKEEENKEIDLESKVTANSALSEYMARNMLTFQDSFNISAFPEAADNNVVIDAFFEAVYQNPLVLGVQGFTMDENYEVYVYYDNDAQNALKKQQEVVEKVEEVVANIITDDMSDWEKNYAINQYLCENSTYDYEALENAQENDFYTVDEAFQDSFTAYGCLMNGVGVCASYAADYKLLADAAGLESIVVTGYLDGATPHAWNKVKLDGTWSIVDSTNNDNEYINNALLNLSDYAASATLVEDDRFVMDETVIGYAAGSDDMEYYHMMQNFYSQDEISDKLAAQLKQQGTTMLRTDYDLNEEEFSAIAQQAATSADKNIQGLYWLGVIYLQEQS